MKLKLTQHAQKRRKLMKVTEDQIQTVVEDPEVTYVQNNHGSPRRMFVRGPLAVVTDDSGTRVVTVIWHRARGRTNDGQPLLFQAATR
ncbi:MAG TPA: hypothetical protein VH482_27410 [Thermomicrobiales bacterium]|jgi:hypothetical protein